MTLIALARSPFDALVVISIGRLSLHQRWALRLGRAFCAGNIGSLVVVNCASNIVLSVGGILPHASSQEWRVIRIVSTFLCDIDGWIPRLFEPLLNGICESSFNLRLCAENFNWVGHRNGDFKCLALRDSLWHTLVQFHFNRTTLVTSNLSPVGGCATPSCSHKLVSGLFVERTRFTSWITISARRNKTIINISKVQKVLIVVESPALIRESFAVVGCDLSITIKVRDI